ncbi:MAG: heparan-alpha-glucosaminide N-acetyltransferase domain-containing protein [Hymenobacter sp.]
MRPTRLVSLDIFRGLTVMLMTVVNNPGDWGHIYPPLEHAEWNGCTPTDLVFPFFLFIVGVSLAYALAGARRDGLPLGPVLVRVARRAAILFGLGVLTSLYPHFDFATVRIMGVLQRIALVYLGCSVICLTTTWRTQLVPAGNLPGGLRCADAAGAGAGLRPRQPGAHHQPRGLARPHPAHRAAPLAHFPHLGP